MTFPEDLRKAIMKNSGRKETFLKNPGTLRQRCTVEYYRSVSIVLAGPCEEILLLGDACHGFRLPSCKHASVPI
jgi:hypothetical protein